MAKTTRGRRRKSSPSRASSKDKPPKKASEKHRGRAKPSAPTPKGKAVKLPKKTKSRPVVSKPLRGATRPGRKVPTAKRPTKTTGRGKVPAKRKQPPRKPPRPPRRPPTSRASRTVRRIEAALEHETSVASVEHWNMQTATNHGKSVTTWDVFDIMLEDVAPLDEAPPLFEMLREACALYRRTMGASLALYVVDMDNYGSISSETLRSISMTARYDDAFDQVEFNIVKWETSNTSRVWDGFVGFNVRFKT